MIPFNTRLTCNKKSSNRSARQPQVTSTTFTFLSSSVRLLQTHSISSFFMIEKTISTHVDGVYTPRVCIHSKTVTRPPINMSGNFPHTTIANKITLVSYQPLRGHPAWPTAARALKGGLVQNLSWVGSLASPNRIDSVFDLIS